MIRPGWLMAALVAPLLSAPVLALRPAPEASPGPELRSVHLLTLPEDLTEDEIVEVIRPINEAIAALGYTGAGYRLWKARTEDAAYQYIWEGVWPGGAAYEAIHAAPEYREATEAAMQIMPKLEGRHTYIRMVEVGGTGFGATHGLESADR